MQMLKKIFSSDNKYYLELKEEIEDSELVQSAVKTAEKTAEVVKEKVQEVAESKPVQSAVKTAEEVVETAQDKVASAISTEEKPNKAKEVKSTKTAQSKANNGAAAKTTEKKQEAKPAQSNSGASSDEPPFWVAAMNNTNKNKTNGNGQVAEQTFAPENLLPIATKYRRRPGGSLDKFKDMAKSAKTPKR